MPKWFAPLVVLAAVGFIGSVGLLLFIGMQQQSVDALEPDPGLEELVFPEFSLTTHRGEAVDESMLEGGVTILDFTFTHCPFACPGMNAEMMRMQGMLDGADVRYVSITVDPLRDTPERLTEHAAALGNHPDWTFLTGDQAEIERILKQDLQFDLTEDEENPITLPDGSVMSNIVHPTRFFLIGPDRQLVSLASYTWPTQVDELARRAREAADSL